MNKWFGAAALGLATIGLAACGETAEQPAAGGDAEGAPGLTVENARLVLPPVAGNPAAIYADFSYDGERAITLRAASVEGAESAEIHETVEHQGQSYMNAAGPLLINPGETMAFEPGGKHIMVFGLPEATEAGGEVEVTVTVLGGDKTSFTAQVRSAGDER